MAEAAEIMRAQIRGVWLVTSSCSREKGTLGTAERQQGGRGGQQDNPW